MIKKPKKDGATRDRLLATAGALISKRSYGTVGVAEICGCAGVTKGSFYHHFDSKAALFQATCDQYWEAKKRRLDAIFSPENDSLTRLERWLAYAEEAQGQCRAADGEAADCLAFSSSAQCGETDAEVRAAGQQIAEKVAKYNTALVRGLQDDGYLLHKSPPESVGRMLGHYVQGLLLDAQIRRDGGVAGAELREAVYKLLGLKPEYWRLPVAAK